MPDKRTAKSCHQSAYGGGWITAAQKLAEMACERAAGDKTLGIKFWELDPWVAVFRREATHASRLLLTPFAFEAVRRALVSPQGRRVRTLGAPFFREMVAEEQKKLTAELERLESAKLPEAVDTLQTPRPMRRPGKSMREKLMDGPEEEN